MGSKKTVLPVLLSFGSSLALADGIVGPPETEPGLLEQPERLQADGGSGGGVGATDRSLAELSLDMINPMGSVFSVFNRLEYNAFQGDLPGAGSQDRFLVDVTASWPFMLDSGKRIVARMNFPINLGEPTYFTTERDYAEWAIRQDADTLPRDSFFFDGHSSLADIEWDVTWGGVSDSGWITGIGIAGVLPTWQDGSIERDQYLLGPDLTLGRMTDWGIIGTRVRHLTDVADVSRPDDSITWDTNETHVSLFFAYAMNNGWSIISNPTAVIDWEGASGNDLLLPLGGGASRMFRWFGVPVKMDIELEYFVASPDAFGPEWLARFSLSPAILDRARP